MVPVVLTLCAGTRSRLQNFSGILIRIDKTSLSDIVENAPKIGASLFGGTYLSYPANPSLSLSTFCKKKVANSFARSASESQSGKQFHFPHPNRLFTSEYSFWLSLPQEITLSLITAVLAAYRADL